MKITNKTGKVHAYRLAGDGRRVYISTLPVAEYVDLWASELGEIGDIDTSRDYVGVSHSGSFPGRGECYLRKLEDTTT